MGEHVVGQDPDCQGGNCNPSVIRRKINKDNIVVHENYDKTNEFANDIALIRLDEAIPLFQEDPTKSAVSPICLPWSEDVKVAWDLKEGQIVTVAGWGRTRSRDSKNVQNQLRRDHVNTKHLQVLKVPIANEKCKAKPFVIDESRQICAGGEQG